MYNPLTTPGLTKIQLENKGFDAATSDHHPKLALADIPVRQ
jgi:hypothetical protein